MSHIAGRRAALVLILAGAAVALYAAFPIVAGLVAAPALAAFFRPLHGRLARHVGANAAALLIVLGLWLGLVIPGAWFAAACVRQAPAAAAAVHRRVDAWRSARPASTDLNVDSLIAAAGASSAGAIPATVGPALGAVVHGVINLSIALLGLFFLLATDTAGWDAVKRRLPFTPAGSDELRDVFTNATRATILGTMASAALQGTSIGIGLRLIGTSAPAVWGVVGGFATLVPVVGNALVWVPAVIVPLVQRQYGPALVMLAWGKVIPSVIDRVVRSGISRRLANLHPMVTLVGVMLGVRLFGPAGVLVGPALAQTGIALVGLFEREYGLWWTISEAGAGVSLP